MQYTYNHPTYQDKVVEQVKAMYREYIHRYIPRVAIGKVANSMDIPYRDVASMVATKKKEVAHMDLTVQVHECFREMMKDNTSRHFAIMDVCDRMRLDYDVVESMVEEEVLIQLTMF